MFFTPSYNTPRSLASNFHSPCPKVDSEKEDKNQQVSLIADNFSALLNHTHTAINAQCAEMLTLFFMPYLRINYSVSKQNEINLSQIKITKLVTKRKKIK